jgi:uncharacterized protein
LFLMPYSGHALVMQDLYAAEVEVAGHGQQARLDASHEALSEVLVRVSGSAAVLQNPVIAAALKRATSYVRQYSYTLDEGATGDLALRLEFDDSVISQLLTEAEEPLWTANRQPVLIWLVVDGPKGRQFATKELVPELMSELDREFSRRGVPVQIPLYDLVDTSRVGVEQVWRLHGPSLRAASGRYGVQDILAGRLVAVSTGRWIGEWTYFAGQHRVDRSISADSAEAFLRSGASIVAEEMAARYAVAPSMVGAHGIGVSVTGVYNYADYANIITWLEGLELIEHANLEVIRAGEIQLRLVAQASARQLAAIIALNERLVQLPSTGNDQLSYQWQN